MRGVLSRRWNGGEDKAGTKLRQWSCVVNCTHPRANCEWDERQKGDELGRMTQRSVYCNKEIPHHRRTMILRPRSTKSCQCFHGLAIAMTTARSRECKLGDLSVWS
jgi:hypothetical protein